MEAVPAEAPLTSPPATVATVLLLLAHVPLPVRSVSNVAEPAHTDFVPPIAAGFGLTVNPNVLLQPVINVYDIVAVPALTPFTVPELTAATAPFVLLHTPPPVLSVSRVENPAQILFVPPIAAGKGFTVTIIDARQPEPREYVIEAVPTATPVMDPIPEDIDAIPAALLDQVPPDGKSDSPTVDPRHTESGPEMFPGVVVIVSVVVR